MFGFVSHIYSKALLVELGVGLFLPARRSCRTSVESADQV